MRAKGAKLELVIPPAISDVIDSMVGTIYGHTRADVARYLIQSAVEARWNEFLSERTRHEQRIAEVE